MSTATAGSRLEARHQQRGVVRLEPGMVVETSYGTGPYLITQIKDGCTCADYRDKVNGVDSERRPHCHLSCDHVDPERTGDYFLNGYDRETLHHVSRDDYLIVKEVSGAQVTLF